MKNLNYKYFTYPLLGIFLTGLINSCGYHLRGDIVVPKQYKSIYILDKGARDIVILLKQRMIENDIELVNAPQLAKSTVVIFPKTQNRRAVAIRGKEIKEYEIKVSVSFAVQNTDGSLRAEKQAVTLLRRYNFDNTQVLGANNEQQILISEMHEDIVNQILRRLSKI